MTKFVFFNGILYNSPPCIFFFLDTNKEGIHNYQIEKTHLFLLIIEKRITVDDTFSVRSVDLFSVRSVDLFSVRSVDPFSVRSVDLISVRSVDLFSVRSVDLLF